MFREVVDPQHVRGRLQPLIEALKGIDGEAVFYDGDLFELCAGLMLHCEAIIDQLDSPHANGGGESSFSSDQGGLSQAASVKDLALDVGLRALTLRMMFEGEFKLFESVVSRLETDLNDLKFSGASSEKIQACETHARASAEAHKDNCRELKDRIDRLELFMATAPNYDLALLAGTEFQQTQEV